MTTINQTVSGGTTNGDIYPSATGQNLGALGQLWNAFLQVCTFGGATSGSTQLKASAIASGVLTLPAGTDTLVGKATTDTLTNKTFTSPVINGTPSGTGIPTMTLKKGSGGGTYSSVSTTYVRVDSTNLAYTVTIPLGWKLLIQASGTAGTNTAAVNCNIALADGSADNTGILMDSQALTPVLGNVIPFSLSWVLTGDGASHTINLQYKTTNGADAATIINSSSTFLPTMTFLLSPSN